MLCAPHYSSVSGEYTFSQRGTVVGTESTCRVNFVTQPIYEDFPIFLKLDLLPVTNVGVRVENRDVFDLHLAVLEISFIENSDGFGRHVS